jgi:hypothetical protein
MNWNDLKSAWSRQEGPHLSDADLALLRQSFEAKRRKLARTLFWRDTREVVAGLFVAGFFALRGWHKGRSYWPMALSVALILGVTGFFVAERIRSHRKRLGSNASVLAKVEADLAELRRQRRLLLNVAVWYIAPLFASWAIALITSIVNTSPHRKHHPLFLICYIALGVPLMTWGVWALNRRAVRKQIEPRLEELEALHRELLSQNRNPSKT